MNSRTRNRTRTSNPTSRTVVPNCVTTNGKSDRLLRVDEVADRLGISIRTVWSLRSSGAIPDAVKIGTATRWRRSEIESHIRSLNAAGR
jgi:excisionase family DNA binding protein